MSKSDAAIVARHRAKRAFYAVSEALWKRRHAYRDQKVKSWGRKRHAAYRHWRSTVKTQAPGSKVREAAYAAYDRADRACAKWEKLRAESAHTLVLRRAQIAVESHVIAKHSRRAPAGPSLMYDSVDLSQIPSGAPAVAGYVGGHWPTYPQLAKRFPHARRVSIAVNASEDAECLDVEAGDARPDQAPAWLARQKQRGLKRPRIYCSVSAAQTVIDTLAKAGHPRSTYRLWTAHYTGSPHVCGPNCGFGFRSTADATQYTDKALGRTLDASHCAPSFWKD